MRLFTSEQVSCGHPDKVCDFIADSILDAYLEQDPYSRVAVEVLIKNEHIVLAGEVTSAAEIDKSLAVSRALEQIGLDYDFRLEDLIFRQSPDIAMGVDTGGAGDQGIMFGYACDETPECLPLSYMLATEALRALRDLRHPMLGAPSLSLRSTQKSSARKECVRSPDASWIRPLKDMVCPAVSENCATRPVGS